MTEIGKKTRKMGRVLQSGSGGVTLNGSSIAMDDASDTMDSQGWMFFTILEAKYLCCAL